MNSILNLIFGSTRVNSHRLQFTHRLKINIFFCVIRRRSLRVSGIATHAQLVQLGVGR